MSAPHDSRPSTGMASRPTERPWTGQSRPTTARPWTAQSRPDTGRPQTGASTRQESSCIISVFEGRGVAREVGIAALDKETGRVMLVQLADGQTYVKTLHQMHLHNPTLILVPDTFISATDASLASSTKTPTSTSPLVQYIEEDFPGVPVEPVARKHWNGQAGLELVSQLCVDDDDRPGIIAAVSNKYYVLSAACALFKYTDIRLNARFANGSLRIRYVQVEGTMMIDLETARNLELVGNATRKKSTHSLLGILNHTYTAMASRLLRVSILAPITVQSAIDARLDVVEELVQSEEKFTDIRDALKTLDKMDFDKLIASLAASEARESGTARPASARVAQMLTLRSVVRHLPLLQRALEGSKSQLLRFVHDMISDERLAKIDALVGEYLNEETAPSKGGIGAVNARVFAVKANRNRLLDVARETYKENIGDIFQLNQGGFVFTIKKDEVTGDLPHGFLNLTMQRGKYLFSSLELKKMNARMKDALEESLILSDMIIQDLVSQILVDAGALYKASEAVATIDMLWSFAHASIMHNYVRPEFTGTLAIKSGRHPVLECVQSAGTLVPNDVYCADDSSFQIVQGPNMSGKSTYLRQIGHLTIMAMCGCFVPAEYASFRIHDALLTRLSNDDNMEKNWSTFANEMTTTAMMLGLATSSSLVLIDELGRAAGIGISHAIAEEFIALKSFVFFATHFDELVTTLSHYPTVVNLHLSVQRTRQSSSNFGIIYEYKIINGIPDSSAHYGLELARLADLPESTLTEATRVAMNLAALNFRQQAESQTSKVAIRRKTLLRLRTQLTQALDHSTLPELELKEYLARIQKDVTKVLKETL